MDYLHNIGAIASDELTYSANMVAVIVAAKVAAERERCAKLLDVAHEKSKHRDNYAAFYARMIRESILTTI